MQGSDLTMKLMRKLSVLRTGWYIWFFPLCALVVTGWLLYRYYNDRGPRIEITFEDASSVQAEKTPIRYRGVPIGTVQDVSLSADQKEAVAVVSLRKDASSFAVEGSRFSLIKPKVGFQGVS